MKGNWKWLLAILAYIIFHRFPFSMLGFAIGALIDASDIHVGSYSGSSRITPGDFLKSLLMLFAATMRADGKVMQSELNYVKNFLLHNFGEQATLEGLQILHELLDREIPLEEVCFKIRQQMNYPARLQVMHFLFGLALADGMISAEELKTIERIADSIGISNIDYDSIRSMFIEETGWAYRVLEIESTATNEEVKKAYRKMAMKYHPDKVNTLGEEVKKAATEKITKLNEAYEKIKRERGMN
jgi:DnaJ like chaperone protein